MIWQLHFVILSNKPSISHKNAMENQVSMFDIIDEFHVQNMCKNSNKILKKRQKWVK